MERGNSLNRRTARIGGGLLWAVVACAGACTTTASDLLAGDPQVAGPNSPADTVLSQHDSRDGGGSDGGLSPGKAWNSGIPASACFSDLAAASINRSGEVFLAGAQVSPSFPAACADNKDVLVAKFDATGKYVGWQSYGYEGDQLANAVAVHPGQGPIVAGDFNGRVMFGGGVVMTATGMRSGFVVKLDPLLRHVFSKQFSSDRTIYPYGIAVDSAGSSVVVGTYAGTVDLGGSPLKSTVGAVVSSDVFIVKLDDRGNHVWSISCGDSPMRPNPMITGNETATAVTTDAAGNIYVIGYFEQTIDLGGGMLANPGPSLLDGYKDVFVAKFDSAGHHKWSERFGEPTGGGSVGYHWGSRIAVDGDGNVIIGGTFRGSMQFGATVLTSATWDTVFVAKLDPSGTPLWSKSLGNDSASLGGLATDASGNIALSGGYWGSIDLGGTTYLSSGMTDVYTAKFDKSGAFVWALRFGDTTKFDAHEDQIGKALAIDGTDAVLSAGTYQNSINFGPSEIDALGKTGIFVSRILP